MDTLLLVIIDTLRVHVSGLAIDPLETDTPLVVNADTMLAGAVASKLLKPIAGRRVQVSQVLCVVQIQQFAPSGFLNIRRQFPRYDTSEDLLGFGVGERFDHTANNIT